MKLETRQPVRIRKAFGTSSVPVRPTCFLVYYDGGLSSLAALREACRQATPGTPIIAVYLDMIPLTEAPKRDDTLRTMASQAILAAASANAAMYGVPIKTLNLECHVRGPALLALAEKYGDAKIFLGIETAQVNELDPFASYIQALEPARVTLVPPLARCEDPR